MAGKTSGDVGQNATVILTITSDNYQDSTVNVNIDLVDKFVPIVMVTDYTRDYNGSKVEISEVENNCTASYGGANVPGKLVLQNPTDFDDVLNAGNYTKTVNFVPDDNTTYKESAVNINIDINKIKPTGKPSFTKITTTGKTLADANILIGSITPVGGNVTWDDGDTTTVLRNKSYGWTYVPAVADRTNYDNLTGITVVWKKKSSGGGSGSSGGSSSTVTPDNKNDKKPVDEGQRTPEFKDVKKGAWYEEPINFMVEKKLMKGTGKEEFRPMLQTSRATIVTILYRMSKEKVDGSKNSFKDVKSGMWYTEAIAWANENGIISGFEKGEFKPNQDLTREQLVVILYRYAMYKKYDSSKNISLSEYDDVNEVSKYSKEAMEWAVANGIIKGTSKTSLSPKKGAIRAELATIFMNFYNKFM